MRELDYSNALNILRDIFWVGFYDKEAHLHCNPYLLIDDQDVVFFDPGSIPHFSIVMRKVIDVVRPEEISLIVASHQDPDVCGSLAVVEDVINRKDLKIAAHTNTIRLIRHYGLNSDFYDVEKEGVHYSLKSGRELEFIPTPFLHAPGAIATYDKKTRTLFTSDLFGAIDREWSLFADEEFLAPMEAFHRLYMPTGRILRGCMERLENYAIDRILPQHGSILEGEQVKTAMAHLKELNCGTDLSGEES